VAAGRAQNVHQPCPANGGRDDLRCQGDVIQEVGELAGGLGVAVLLVEDEPFDGGN
jgi:hypothetical protein